MDTDQAETRAFLFELYTQTGGDPDVQVSMYDVARAIGLEENDAGPLAESLYIQELAELKTLSGGMGITPKGLAALDVPLPAGSGNFFTLPTADIMQKTDKDAVLDILDTIKKGAGRIKSSHESLEQYIIDVKCIELQMMAPEPRTQIIRHLFISIKKHFKNKNQDEIISLIDTVTG